jgi:hypothetical protein
MEQHICVEDNGPFFDHNDHQVLKKVFNPLAHRLLPRSAIGYQTKDLALIDLATRFRRILITSFIPVVLDFMGYGLRNSAVGGFFIGEMEMLHEIHHNLLSFPLVLLRQSILRDVVIRRLRCGLHTHLLSNHGG